MALTLDELIESYGSHNAEFGSLKKVCDHEKEQIKQSLLSQGLSEKTSGGWKVTCTTTTRESLNEELMLQILKKDWESRYGEDVPCPYIKTREYIDMDVLETVLYADELPKATLLEMDACRNVTEIVTLRCNKVKAKKQEED